VRVVEQPVQDAVSKSGITDLLVSPRDRQLRHQGDDNRRLSVFQALAKEKSAFSVSVGCNESDDMAATALTRLS
jgi:hypothetical protein